MVKILINGVAMPTPTELQVGIMDISKAERNASGRMIIERIATKRKLFLTYAYITSSDASKILKMISPAYYNVTYNDPQEGHLMSGQFYCGDRQLGYLDYINGVPRYKDFGFNLIEL
jgi:hypothetical protein